MSKIIETGRLRLVCCTTSLLDALFEGDEELGKYLNVSVPVQWSVFGEPAFRWTYEQLKEPGVMAEWHTYLPVLRKERILVGSGGYKGKPYNGVVEIGYEITQMHRGKGLATEMARALIENAFADAIVTKVQAHTLAEQNESGSVLKNCGMLMVEEIDDPEDGKIWRWEMGR